MGELASWSERRRALRVPVRGVAVFYGEDGALHGRIENLSQSGALVTVAAPPPDRAPPRGHPGRISMTGEREALDVELKLGGDTGWVGARAVRIEKSPRRWRMAVEFERLEPPVRAAIEAAIESALRAAQRRPILVVDDDVARRIELVTRLAARGMTPLAPRTPLEAVDLLARPQLHVNVCLVAPSFGHTLDELRALLADSFPWLSFAAISPDLDATIDRALDAWAGTAVARLSPALA